MSANPQSFSPPETEAQPPVERKASAGRQLYEFLVYGWGNFLGTFGISAALAVAQKRYFPHVIDGVTDWIKARGVSSKIAETFANVAITSWGGIAMLFPIHWMESRRDGIIDSFNKWLGDPTPREVIESEPRQTWGSLIKSRLTVMAIITPSMSTLGHFIGPQLGKLEHAGGQLVADWMKAPTHRNLSSEISSAHAHLSALRASSALDGAQAKELTRLSRVMEAHESLPYTSGRMLAVDSWVTLAAASIFYTAKQIFAIPERTVQAIVSNTPRGIAPEQSFADRVRSESPSIGHEAQHGRHA